LALVQRADQHRRRPQGCAREVTGCASSNRESTPTTPRSAHRHNTNLTDECTTAAGLSLAQALLVLSCAVRGATALRLPSQAKPPRAAPPVAQAPHHTPSPNDKQAGAARASHRKSPAQLAASSQQYQRKSQMQSLARRSPCTGKPSHAERATAACGLPKCRIRAPMLGSVSHPQTNARLGSHPETNAQLG